MSAASVPAWLASWRAGAAQPLNRREPVPAPGAAPTAPAAPAQAGVRRTVNGMGFSEPVPWPLDGCERREAVLDTDHNPPRVVRRVGWQRCMKCRKPFWSDDVVRLRLCDGQDGGCRGEPIVRQSKRRE